MDISVLVPIYKVEKYVEKCLRSLFEQTKTDGVEFVLVNDCTPDNSMEIVHRVVAEYPNLTIKIIENEVNKGIAATRQIGLDAMTGDYTIHVDSDDWCEPTMLEELYDAAIKNNADIVCCDLYRDGEGVENYLKYNVPTSNGVECAALLLNNKLRGNLFIKLVKRSLYTDNNIKFVEGINLGEDLVISAKLFLVAQNVFYLPRAYYHYIDYNIASLSIKPSLNRLVELHLLAIEEIDRFINGLEIHDLKLEKALKYRKLQSRFELMYAADRKSRKQFANIFPESIDYISESTINPMFKFGILCAAKGVMLPFNIALFLSKTINKCR